MALLGSRRNAVGHTRDQQNKAAGNQRNSVGVEQKYLTNCKSLYSCIYCRTHLANHDELISRSFQGNRSRAYLFNSLINITTGPSVQRELNTGAHAVADVFCSNCSTTIGWKYEKAYVESQKYKEGKYIIELAHVVRENRHLELDKRDQIVNSLLGAQQTTQYDDVGGSLSPPPPPFRSGDRSSIGSSPPLNCDQQHHLYACLDDFEQDNATTLSATGSDEEEEEVLMFPFHDDLYGERASYSNLSHSRLSSYKRRVAAVAASAHRRSLHLDFDWRLGGTSFTSTISSGAPKSQPMSPTSSPDNHHDHHNCDDKFSPKMSTFSSSASSSNSNEAADCQQAGTSKDIKHFNTNNNQKQCDQDKSSSSSVSSCIDDNKQATTNNSINLAPNIDDEETFYDCCTDHNISSSSSSSSVSPTNK